MIRLKVLSLVLDHAVTQWQIRMRIIFLRAQLPSSFLQHAREACVLFTGQSAPQQFSSNHNLNQGLSTKAILFSKHLSAEHLGVFTLREALLTLLLPLPRELLDLLWRRVFNKIAVLVQARPLGQTIRDVNATLAVEHVASMQNVSTDFKANYQVTRHNSPRREVLLLLLTLEFDQRREKQDHIAALIHDGAVAVRAADFAGQLVLDRFARGVVPFQVVVAILEADVVLVEDCCPLEGSGWVGC